MKMILKALVRSDEEHGDEYDDFFFTYDAYIGPDYTVIDPVTSEDISHSVNEVFRFHVISLKRLEREMEDNDIMLNKGWMIVKFCNEGDIRSRIESIIRMCPAEDEEEAYKKLSRYFLNMEYDI